MADRIDIPTSNPTVMPPFQNGICYRIHRVTCPMCGHVAWVILLADSTPAEIEMAREAQVRRMLSEPCEVHEMM